MQHRNWGLNLLEENRRDSRSRSSSSSKMDSNSDEGTSCEAVVAPKKRPQ